MATLRPQDWVRIAEDEQLPFVAAGGALVRFIVGDSEGEIDPARRWIREMAGEQGFLYAEVDGSQYRLHLPNEILQAITTQLDLRALITNFVLQTVIREGYEVPSGAEKFVLSDVARLNDILEIGVLQLVKRRVRKDILSDSRLMRDFKYSILAMVDDVVEGSDLAPSIDLTKRWLAGDVPRIRELRNAGIVQKVNRYNARGLLRSLLSWVPSTGYRGSIVVIDATALKDATHHYGYRARFAYTRRALTDAYEVMREFIDETDEMHHAVIVFGMPVEFLSIDPSGRGMGAYQALEFRVSGFEEARLPNPLANLVQLSIFAPTQGLYRDRRR